MSGLRGRRVPPADIFIVPRQWDPGPPGGVTKTSKVTVNRPIGDDLKLGLLIKKNQTVDALEFRDATTNSSIGSGTDITSDPQWSGALGALRWFTDPGTDNQWILFKIPKLDAEFTSEFTLRPVPTPPQQQNVTVVAIHVAPNESEATVKARIRQGAYGYGVSVVRAPDNDWPP